MSSGPWERWAAMAREAPVEVALWGLWTAGVLVLAALSLGWPISHDLPPMAYIAWMVGEGAVPYRDLFDMNLPGTYAVHRLIQGTLGDGDLAYRIGDLVVLGLTLGGVARLAGQRGLLVGATAALWVATAYLLCGPDQTLQRDWLLVGPWVYAVGWAVAPEALAAEALVAGGALGFAMAVKPQTVGVVALVVALRVGARSGLGRDFGAMGAGFLAVLGALGLWTSPEGLAALWASWTGYLGPVYANLGGDGLPVASGLGGRLWGWRVYGAHTVKKLIFPLLYLSPAILALALRRWRGFPPRLALGALGLVALGVASFVLPNKLWGYHGWPLAAALLVVVSVQVDGASAPSLRGLAPALRYVMPIMGLLSLLWWGPGAKLVGEPEEQQDAAELASKFAALPAGARVQWLDTVSCGAAHGALRAHRPLATSFVYDFHFWHRGAESVVASFRGRFMNELAAHPPAVVVICKKSWFLRNDYDAIAGFPEFAGWLEAGYSLESETARYRWYVPRSGARP